MSQSRRSKSPSRRSKSPSRKSRSPSRRTRDRCRSKEREKRRRSPDRRRSPGRRRSPNRRRSRERNESQEKSRDRSGKERRSREETQGYRESSPGPQETEQARSSAFENLVCKQASNVSVRNNELLAGHQPDAFIVQAQAELTTVKVCEEVSLLGELSLGGRKVNAADLRSKPGTVSLNFPKEVFPQLYDNTSNHLTNDSSFALLQKRIKVKEEPGMISVGGGKAVVQLRVRNVTDKDVFIPKGVTLALFKLSPSLPNLDNGRQVLTLVDEEEPLPPGDEAICNPPAIAPPSTTQTHPNSTLDSMQPSTTPTSEELLGWSVKRLKACLAHAQLHQYGLKADLVSRLNNFFQQHPDRVVELLDVAAAQQGQVASNSQQGAPIPTESRQSGGAAGCCRR